MENITFKLNFASTIPLYEQLYAHIVREIKEENLTENERLPSKRSLCAHLKISQSTVETAYDILVAEGYVRSVPRSGYFVCNFERLEKRQESAPIVPENIKNATRCRYDFSTSAVDTSVFPYSSWAKLNKEVVYQQPELLLRGDKQGDLFLREALSRFLYEYRGVRCLPDQLIVGAGMEYLLDLLLQLFGENDVFALENPGYATTYRTIENNNRKIIPVSLDDRGMDVELLSTSGANIAYVTPSHQFPMGITMPIGRRTKLLKWANSSADRYVIEDDYDSEFRASVRPVPAMQGLDENGKVIYIGTFSRSIAPSIRVAYLCLPLGLLNRYREKFFYSSSSVSRFEQQILARFIEKGLYARHLNRVGNLYRQRKNCLIDTFLQSPLKDKIAVRGAEAGLHFLLDVNNGMSEKELTVSAAEAGVRVRGLSQYYHSNGENCPKATLVLGYAGLSAEDIKKAVELLSKIWK